jgi:hypothetical protein
LHVIGHVIARFFNDLDTKLYDDFSFMVRNVGISCLQPKLLVYLDCAAKKKERFLDIGMILLLFSNIACFFYRGRSPHASCCSSLPGTYGAAKRLFVRSAEMRTAYAVRLGVFESRKVNSSSLRFTFVQLCLTASYRCFKFFSTM